MNSDTVIYFCGLIVAVDRVIDIFLKFKGRAESPNVEINKRVTALEAELEKVHGFLARDKQRLDTIDLGSAILQKSILALIDNAIDDSDKKPLLDAKKDLNEFLIDRKIII